MKPHNHRLARFVEAAIPVFFTIALVGVLLVMFSIGLWALAGVLR